MASQDRLTKKISFLRFWVIISSLRKATSIFSNQTEKVILKKSF